MSTISLVRWVKIQPLNFTKMHQGFSLRHWDPNKMAYILQTPFSNAFSGMKTFFLFWLNFTDLYSWWYNWQYVCVGSSDHSAPVRPPQQGSWGQHGDHLGPVVPRWAPCWPHEPSYLGQAMNWANVQRDLWHHVALVGPHELNVKLLWLHFCTGLFFCSGLTTNS